MSGGPDAGWFARKPRGIGWPLAKIADWRRSFLFWPNFLPVGLGHEICPSHATGTCRLVAVADEFRTRSPYWFFEMLFSVEVFRIFFQEKKSLREQFFNQ